MKQTRSRREYPQVLLKLLTGLSQTKPCEMKLDLDFAGGKKGEEREASSTGLRNWLVFE
jgi:hypothetical protein